MQTIERVRITRSPAGIPTAMLLHGERFRVTDRPTRWSGRGDSWDFGPVEPRESGDLALWRFQATPVSGVGASIVVDVIDTPHGWMLLGLVH
ncbi:hypothetical protein [Curtobacterium ammoniigenes]|uniref:hypothetical protein n=1 Tax=Curtobacterium ammoniigenes TaxID=395387 RepID=UPI000A587098|nr:hypothetical protein [Curtobacterium ammoniigenes]